MDKRHESQMNELRQEINTLKQQQKSMGSNAAHQTNTTDN